MESLRHHELRITLTPDDQPEDRFTDHVNNARYFAFINRTFHGWYVAMGIRGGIPGFTAVMAHVAYDFLRQVHVPGEVLCRVSVVRVGNRSLEHAIEMWDMSSGTPQLAGRGRAVHVWIDRASGRSEPWPVEVLARCWTPAPAAPAEGSPGG
jgi:acyl-CoA thioester hydrolase